MQPGPDRRPFGPQKSPTSSIESRACAEADASFDGLIYLSETSYWRNVGWRASPAAAKVAVGRASDSIGNLSMYFQVFGFLIIAGALIALGKLCRSEDSLPSRLGLLVYIESAALAGIAVALVVPSDAVYNELALLTGVLIGLALTIWLAWQLGKLARQSATTFAN